MNVAVQAINPDYMAGNVSWNDRARGMHVDGTLSCWGSDINDAILGDTKGCNFPFVRSQNYNEKLGIKKASAICLGERDGVPFTLLDVLRNPDDFCTYRGLRDVVLGVQGDDGVIEDENVVVRVQQPFVPVQAGEKKRNVVVHNYSYATFRDDDPVSLMLVASARNLSVHTDTASFTKLHAHQVGEDGKVTKHYFVAEPTTHAVGAAHVGDAEPLQSKKAFEMGLAGMGPRANCILVVSIPREQAPRPLYGGYDDEESTGPLYRSLSASTGVAKAARMSVDTSFDDGVAAPLSDLTVTRKKKAPITVTMMLYNTVEGEDGAKVDVSSESLRHAIDDMERIYGLCDVTCKLSELPAMLEKMSPVVMDKIKRKFESCDKFVPTTNAASVVWGPSAS